jgi:hypothetical protein
VVRSLSSTSSSEVLPAPPTVKPWLQDPSDLKVTVKQSPRVSLTWFSSIAVARFSLVPPYSHDFQADTPTATVRPFLEWESYSIFPFSCGFVLDSHG